MNEENINSKKINKYNNLDSLFLWFSSISLIAFFIMAWFPGYLGIPTTEMLSGPVLDGWCAPVSQGVGNHCFGDYYYPLNFINSNAPWEAENPVTNSAGALLILTFYNYLSIFFDNDSLGLKVFLFSSPIFTIALFIKSFRKFRYPKLYVFLLSSFVLASSPFIIAFDRGNVILLTLPLVIILLRSYMEKRDLMFLLTLILLSFLKPQLLIFVLILLTRKKVIQPLIYLLISIAANVIPFFFFGGSVINNIKSYLKVLISFQDYALPGQLVANISLPNSIALIERFGFSTPVSEISYIPSFISMFGLVFVCIYLWIYGSKFDPMHNFLILTLYIILAPNVSYAYYLILLLAYLTFAALKYIENFSNSESNSRELNFLDSISTRSRILVLLSCILLFVPWAIPWITLIPHKAVLNSSEFAASVSRFPGQVILFILFLSLVLTRDKKFRNASKMELQ